MTDFLEVGFIKKPHGFRGAFVISSKSEALFEAEEIGLVQNSDPAPTFFEIQEKSLTPKGWLLRLGEIKSDAEVKENVGKPVFISRDFLPKLEENEFYAAELENFEARDSKTGNYLGRFLMAETLASDSVDRWWFKNASDSFAILANKRFVDSIDTEKKIIYLKNLDELA